MFEWSGAEHGNNGEDLGLPIPSMQKSLGKLEWLSIDAGPTTAMRLQHDYAGKKLKDCCWSTGDESSAPPLDVISPPESSPLLDSSPAGTANWIIPLNKPLLALFKIITAQCHSAIGKFDHRIVQ